jgi:prepilin-type processing-associated H-X9-DG protein
LAKAKQAALAAKCLSNKKQMHIAWAMYAGDFSDNFAYNCDQSVPYTNGSTVTAPWCGGILDWTATANSINTNLDVLVNPLYASLGSYIASTPMIYWCPADTYLSPDQSALGWPHRSRSVSMNSGVGGGARDEALGWIVYTAVKSANLVNPGPANSWLFLDEHPNSIDDDILYVNPGDTNGFGFMTELPSSLHNNAGTVSFCDGHAEIHKWFDPKTLVPVNPSTTANMTLYVRVPVFPSVDLAWLAQKTPNSAQ